MNRKKHINSKIMVYPGKAREAGINRASTVLVKIIYVKKYL